MCGTVLCGFGGVSVCCVWGSLGRVCGCEFVLCVGEFGAGFMVLCLCCVWDSLLWVCGSEFVLC